MIKWHAIVDDDQPAVMIPGIRSTCLDHPSSTMAAGHTLSGLHSKLLDVRLESLFRSTRYLDKLLLSWRRHLDIAAARCCFLFFFVSKNMRVHLMGMMSFWMQDAASNSLLLTLRLTSLSSPVTWLVLLVEDGALPVVVPDFYGHVGA